MEGILAAVLTLVGQVDNLMQVYHLICDDLVAIFHNSYVNNKSFFKYVLV